MELNKTKLDYSQVANLSMTLKIDIKKKLLNEHPAINKFELDYFVTYIVLPKIKAILCTLNDAAYEDIIKIVHEKLDLDNLFEEREKYLIFI